MSKRCLIIGASGDIGAACARELIEDGYSVYLHYFSNESIITQLKQEIPASQWIGASQADLASDGGVASFINKIDPQWDAVVFAGGHHWRGLFQEMTPEDMDHLYYLHMKAPWLIAKHVLPEMISRKQGQMVIVSSIWGEEGASLEAAYSAVKGAQISFVKGLAKEVAPSGIRINAITPGLISSKMNADLSKEEIAELEDEIPLGRAGTCKEAAQSVAFLLSEKASYITGHILKVNGGWN
ncbi:SDR family oxidoreductase [Halobacillus rhizosphaerae]|uniref:elongation factor P 5-aminopentanone reductase n=1 Tax=Halobacillus rhizosphaerae TaxID=3064889 RepID=UPI00398B4BC6